MTERVIKLPDVGEGIAEAELVEWHVAVGDEVKSDDLLAAVMTDKATVEIPAPEDGKVLWLAGEIGSQIAVGSPLIRLEVDADGETAAEEPAPTPRATPEPDQSDAPPVPDRADPAPSAPAQPAPPAAAALPSAAELRRRTPGARRVEGEKPLASPAVRKRALDTGIDLRQVSGSGPAGRITHDDLDLWLESGGPAPAAGFKADHRIETVKLIGLRRKIAARMSLAKRRIPHITYVEEVDVTALEELRAELNREQQEGRPRLTILPFLARGMVRALKDHPEMNARFDDEAEEVERHGGVHLGIAAQTPAGLMVPVVRHAEALDLFALAVEIQRLGEAARSGTASRDELSGSTITITSLGPLGGIVSTPVINHPEVAIVGVNKIATRPVWDGSDFQPRKIMNLSSSFDHRVVDGHDAARFIQRIKALLETPAMIFLT
jgi:2-oxoisovalerate dehydrogenase E2 component (dihydrolipoyl transacylase)